MDADLIRLILLILGVALVAGIWLWDRWQRGQGEPPMVRRREPDEPEHDDEPTFVEAEPDWQPVEPTERVPGPDPDDEDEAPATDERDEPRLVASTATPSRPAASAGIEVDEAAPLPKVEHQPAWLRPGEPVIPAFVMSADSEPLDRSGGDDVEPRVPDADASHVDPAAAAPVVDIGARGIEIEPPASSLEQQPPQLLATDDEPEIPVLELAPEPAHAPRPSRAKAKEAPKPKPEAEPVNIRMDEDQIDLDLGFSAVDDQDLQDVAVDLPDLIVQINIVARGEPFTGEQILAAMDQVEMQSGDHDIFHRYDNQGRRKSLFSLASMVEPGTFPLKKMRDFSTPGLTLFAQLPGPRDGLLVYSDMLYVAERLARLLDAKLKDASRSTLTKQTIEHTRERIAEHKRQITLKLRQAGDKQRGRR